MKRIYKNTESSSSSASSDEVVSDSDTGNESPPAKRRVPRGRRRQEAQDNDGFVIAINDDSINNKNDSGINSSPELCPWKGNPIGRLTFRLPSSSSESAYDSDAFSNISISTDGSFPVSEISLEVAREIYRSCSKLFKSKKISPNNAFSLKLVENLNVILELDELMGPNLLTLHAHVLEIGARIYVCRVEHTHAQCLRLAEQVSRFLPDAAVAEVSSSSLTAESEEISSDICSRQRNRKRRITKFVVDEESKLNTQFEDRSTNAAWRRNTLKSKLMLEINEDIDFDYLSFSKSNSLNSAQEYANFGTEVRNVPGHDEPPTITWLPFNHISDYDPELVDLWGIPRDLETSDNLLSVLQQDLVEGDIGDLNEFTHNPNRSPSHYTRENYDPGHENDNSVVGSSTLPTSVDDIKSLDDLKRLIESTKVGDVLNMCKQKYGFSSPWSYQFKHPCDSYKKARRRNRKVFTLCYDDINLDNFDDQLVYNISADPSAFVLSEQMLSDWSRTNYKLCSPYVNPSESYENIIVEEEDVDSDDYVSKFTSYFTNPNRRIHPSVFRPETDNEPGDNLDNSKICLSPADSMELEFFRSNFDGESEDFGDDAMSFGVENSVNWDSLLHLFPEGLLQRLDHVTDINNTNNTLEDVSRYVRNPKLIDMRGLKTLLLGILKEKLYLDNESRPTMEQPTSLDFVSILNLVRHRSVATLKNITVPLIFVGLLHIVAENKLFFDPPTDCVQEFYNPLVVCRGKNWSHAHAVVSSIQSEDRC